MNNISYLDMYDVLHIFDCLDLFLEFLIMQVKNSLDHLLDVLNSKNHLLYLQNYLFNRKISNISLISISLIKIPSSSSSSLSFKPWLVNENLASIELSKSSA